VILVIDNYDSFTFNLVQVLAARGAKVEVVRNDEITAAAALDRQPAGILLSPGPGRPENAGICPELMAGRPEVPVLGVCLGHQVLGASFGGTVGRCPTLMHGKTSAVEHDGSGVFEGLSNPFEATRYHSLELRRDGLSEELEQVAWTESGVLMGVSHRTLPYWGVQFHPESVLTLEGPRLLENFLRLCGEDSEELG
jgi:anthranilate synthase/aminodeoxychorismate synthase-like glutamine amidotransferase